jgi:NAD(P)-dependent dehydrogenase (short-subunit alcohol dehydrogenase family)
VFATARKPEDLARLANDEGVEAVHLELSDKASIAACVRDVLGRTGGKLDALFNNAAYGQIGAVEDLTADVLREQIEVNVIGTHDVTRQVIPAMRAQGHGRIVQCSSVLGFVSGPYRGAYCASKFALEGLTDALRMELASTGIKVALIEPGPIATRFVDNAIAALKANIDMEGSPHRETYVRRLEGLNAGGQQTFKLEPEAVVRKLIHAVESPKPKLRYFVTIPTYAAAMLKRVLPARMIDMIANRQ